MAVGLSLAVCAESIPTHFLAPMTLVSLRGTGVMDPKYESIFAAHDDYSWVHYPDSRNWVHMNPDASFVDMQERYPESFFI